MAAFARAQKSPTHRWRVISALMAGLAFALMITVSTAGQAHAATLLSQGQPTTASSLENATVPATAATDGNTGTRWSSAFPDPQWIQVDLGATATISQVVLQWEAAYGKAFQVQVSPDATNWTSIYSTSR
jgi:hypothetical protein